MPRITISLRDEQHRSLKLLSILEEKTLARVLQEAIEAHLRSKGDLRLELAPGPEPSD